MLVRNYIFLISFLFISFAQAAIETQKLQILAAKVTTNNDTLIATGDVVIYSPKYYITADKVIYDKKLETLELFDNVIIIKDNKIKTQSNYSFLDMKKDELLQNPSFLINNASNVWIDTNVMTKENDEFSFGSAVISSCDCIDPMWSLRFSSGYYDELDQFIHTFNTRLYIKSMPIFYTPYFGFSTNTNRRTGLLRPTIGFSSGEGFVYSQPIFYAPEANYDFEFVPQYKSNRGVGLYSYFRYADSAYSTLKVKVGAFKEQDSYYKEHDLDNQKHYGWDLDYVRSNLFSDNENNKDALFVSLSYLNDVEFITLEGDESAPSDKKITSKINYYFNTPSYYAGTYLRYYLDRSIDDNSSTLQQLPQVQAHKYIDSVFYDNLLYSVDVKNTNYTRENGLNANMTDVNVPISLSFSFFDDFLNLTLSEELQLSKIDYSNSSRDYENAYLAQNLHVLDLSTDLIKPYSSFIHTINLSSKFTFADTLKQSGDIYKINGENQDDSDLSSFSLSKNERSVALGLNQSFYSQIDLSQIINHKMTQNITYDSSGNSKLTNLENTLSYNFDLGTFSNRFVYSNEDKTFIENSTTVKFDFNDFGTSVGHYKSKDTPNSNKDDLESANIALRYKINKKYNIAYKQNYNIHDKIKSKESFIFSISEDCWALSLELRNEIITSSSADTTKQSIIFINFELKPITSVRQKFKIREE
ncbi:MAG: LPS-assembly protein LptD [Campylobacteraceae bacterium]|nr:LPS-assembly protein LptD [Campylobacteraceae bacterium]